MRTIWIPLVPDGKAPIKEAAGWQSPDYQGVAYRPDARLGLRTDDYIVVDCDDLEARDAWLRRIDKPIGHTTWRKTPNGWHFFYKRTMANLHVRGGPRLPKTDVKCGIGHYVVYHAEGYGPLQVSPDGLMVFDPAWLPDNTQEQWVGEEWSEMPEGIGDNSMMSFAGTFRRWGMDEVTIRTCLKQINAIVMKTDPMPPKSIRRIARQAAKYNPADAKSAMCPHCGGEVEFR